MIYGFDLSLGKVILVEQKGRVNEKDKEEDNQQGMGEEENELETGEGISKEAEGRQFCKRQNKTITLIRINTSNDNPTNSQKIFQPKSPFGVLANSE